MLKIRGVHYCWVLLICLLAGCATTQGLPAEDRTRIIAAPYDQVFRAALDVAVEAGYPVESADMQSGLISTGYLTNSDLASVFVGRMRNRATIYVKALDSTRTQLTLTYVLENVNAFGASNARNVGTSVAEQLYSDGLDIIESKATGRILRGGLEILKLERAVDEYGNPYVAGELRNSRGRAYSALRIEINAVDEGGVPVGMTTADVGAVAPGTTATFRAFSPSQAVRFAVRSVGEAPQQ